MNGKRTGSKAIYSCLPGYVLFGNQVSGLRIFFHSLLSFSVLHKVALLQELVCDVGGEWSGKPPSCKYIDCGLPIVIDNGRYNLVNGTTTSGSIVEYTCNEDYWLEQPNRKRQMCTREGKWVPEAPS